MSFLAVAPQLANVEADELVPYTVHPVENGKKESDKKKRWTQVLARSLLLGLIVALIMAGVTVISSYIAIGAPPNWRSVLASSFSSFMLTAILTFVLNYM